MMKINDQRILNDQRSKQAIRFPAPLTIGRVDNGYVVTSPWRRDSHAETFVFNDLESVRAFLAKHFEQKND